MKTYPAKLLFVLIAALPGCYQNPSHPERDGSIKAVVWPAPEKAKLWTGQGVFPAPENIVLLNKGMTKDQVYFLIGRPHFDEGIFSVREWDYLLHFRTPGIGMNGITTCQLKIIYNPDKRVSGIYWRSADLKDRSCPPDFVQQKESYRYILSADILFGLNQYQLDKSNHDMLKNIDKIISDIKGKGGYDSITVYGYTDWQGSSSYNMKLSALRAGSVANYFISNGFPKNKVFPKGMGKTIPETSCSGLINEKLTECLLPDRKVVVVVNPVKSNGK